MLPTCLHCTRGPGIAAAAPQLRDVRTRRPSSLRIGDTPMWTVIASALHDGCGAFPRRARDSDARPLARADMTAWRDVIIGGMPTIPPLLPALPPYVEALPPPALRDRLCRVWRYRVEPAADAQSRVLPDGCVDLIWDGRRLFVAGPDQQASVARLAAGTTLTGLRLAPGTAHRVLGTSMQALTDRRVDADTVLGTRARALQRRLGECADPLPTLLAAVAASDVVVDTRMAWLFAALSADRSAGIPALAHGLGISERGLHRHCLQAFGYGPKVLERILRLQRLLRLAGQVPTLTAAALDAGYADATHLSHDVRRLTGLTPTQLVRDHGH